MAVGRITLPRSIRADTDTSSQVLNGLHSQKLALLKKLITADHRLKSPSSIAFASFVEEDRLNYVEIIIIRLV